MTTPEVPFSGQIRVDTHQDFLTDQFMVRIAEFSRGQIMSVADPLTFSKVEQGSLVAPTIKVGGREFLQACLEAAWEAGMRPVGYGDTKEQAKALNAHLQDMRSIAFHKIGAQKP
jgi:hypothetical protein